MRRAAILVLLAAAATAAAAVSAGGARAGTIVALAPGAPVPPGAKPVAPRLRMWLVPDRVAARLDGVVASGPNRRVEPLGREVDPLEGGEWWLDAVGADGVQPPGPGKLVAIVDSGVDASHPELSAAHLLLLNAQRTQPGPEEHHGTAVASIVGAPADGRGMVGVYPGAALAAYDTGAQTLADVLGGIGAALEQPGPGVINLSVGFRGPAGADLLRIGVDSAVAAGWLVVAAAGNSGSRTPVYPAALPHVLTVAATDRNDAVAAFSTRSPAIDLAAPGVGILAAVPTWKDPSGFATLSGTSFAAPIVSGAAAWLWTSRPALDATQVAELLRRSATDIDLPRFDDASGWGLLSIPAALGGRAPIRDPQEPNDDVDLVAAGGLFTVGTPPLVDARLVHTRVAARLDRAEDPADLYRVFVPAGRELVAGVDRGQGVQLAIWGPHARSLGEGEAKRRRDLISSGRTVRTRNVSRKGAYYYLAATLRPETRHATYLVSVSLRGPR
ncbi:MAG TPA: S8 family serine peptidase [Gaiellaceae bacterium]|nr:S8 family serine peptidase [Gaiellaceae bacterium]